MPSSNAARSCLAIILAAGEGTRMRSGKPKVLHEVAGRPMLSHVLAAVRAAGAERIAVVVGPDRDDVGALVRREAPEARIFVQRERLGTAHAVLAARESFAPAPDDCLVAFADTPLVEAQTLERLRQPLAESVAVTVLGFTAADPTGYGRLLMEAGSLAAIREERDASPEERAIRLCNGGLMGIAGEHALALLDAVTNENAKREYYLSDLVALARGRGLRTAVVEAPEAEIQGVNDRLQLAKAERTLQDRLRTRAMMAGVTLIDPGSVHLAADTRFERDVVIEPFVVFGPGVSVGEGAVIHAFSHLEGAEVGPGVSVGPYARLRPGARLARGSRVGNFVELKATELGEGAKVNHLTYLGDASVGAGANVGAGTITCNYDGFAKHRTTIGEGAFVGSNSALVAPVTIGANAYVGSGSVITDSVPEDALAVARGRQAVKDGWAAAFRARKSRKG